MSSIGPQLPPHLQSKRKRDSESDEENSGPRQRNSSRSSSPPSSPNSASKRRRVMGPAPPPAPLDERPPHPSNVDQDDEDSSSDDDDFGPSLPNASDAARSTEEGLSGYDSIQQEGVKEDTSVKRDEWMMVPPKQDDLAARMDPTKFRARGFNSGKGAKGPSSGGGMDSAWTETPEEKRKRLAKQVMGISEGESSGTKPHPVDHRKKAEDEEKARRIREYNEKHRARSLYAEHQDAEKKQKEDDPSKRGFDYEKDMGGGTKIGHKQRQELMKKAGDFSSRFSSGSYL